MEVVELEINYIEMVDHFCNIMNDITNIQSEITGWKWREKSKPDNVFEIIINKYHEKVGDNDG